MRRASGCSPPPPSSTTPAPIRGPARSAAAAAGIVGVVIDDRVRDAFRDPVNIAMLDGVARPSARSTRRSSCSRPAKAAQPVSLETAPLDAVVLIGCSPTLERSIAMLTQRGIPVVVIEGDAGENVPEIALDNREATRLGAEHLRELGHERVGIVLLPLDPTAPAAR